MSDGNPYIGLRPFRDTEHDRKYFCGRQKHTAELCTLIEDNHFVAIIGTSGCGKSSLVNAGVIPQLRGSNNTVWRITRLHPGDSPVVALARAVADNAFFPAFSRGLTMEQRIAFILSDQDREAGLLNFVTTQCPFEMHEEANDGEPGEEPLVTKRTTRTKFLIIADQFEELFRFGRKGAVLKPNRQEAFEFVQILRQFAADKDLPVHIVVSMRSDFLQDCAAYEGLVELIHSRHYLVPALDIEGRSDAIAEPAEKCGVRIPALLVGNLAGRLSLDPDQLPLLQHSLWYAWHRKWGLQAPKEGAVLDTFGEVENALNDHADARLADFCGKEFPQKEKREAIAGKVFKTLTVSDKGRLVRRPVPFGMLKAITGLEHETAKEAVDFFRQENPGFLLPDTGERAVLGDATVIDICHESLIRKWKHLNEWAEEEAARLLNWTFIEKLTRQEKTISGGVLESYETFWSTSRPTEQWLAVSDPATDRPGTLSAASRMGRVANYLARCRAEWNEQQAARRALEEHLANLKKTVEKSEQRQGELLSETERLTAQSKELEEKAKEADLRWRRLRTRGNLIVGATAGLAALAAAGTLIFSHFRIKDAEEKADKAITEGNEKVKDANSRLEAANKKLEAATDATAVLVARGDELELRPKIFAADIAFDDFSQLTRESERKYESLKACALAYQEANRAFQEKLTNSTAEDQPWRKEFEDTLQRIVASESPVIQFIKDQTQATAGEIQDKEDAKDALKKKTGDLVKKAIGKLEDRIGRYGILSEAAAIFKLEDAYGGRQPDLMKDLGKLREELASATTTRVIKTMERREATPVPAEHVKVGSAEIGPAGTPLDGWLVYAQSNSREVGIFSYKTKETMPEKEIGTGGGISDIAIRPDGLQVAVGTKGDTVWLVTLDPEKRTIASRDRYARQQSYVYDVTYSEDGKLVACAGKDGSVRAFESESLRTRYISSWRSSSPNAVRFSTGWTGARDMPLVAFTSDDGRVTLSDLNVPKLLWYGNYEARSTNPEFNADGTLVTAAGNTGYFKIWQTKDGQTPYGLVTRRESRSQVNQACFQPRQGGPAVVASVWADGVVLVSVLEKDKTDFELIEAKHSQSATCAEWTRTGRWLATGGADGLVLVWDFADFKTPRLAARVNAGSPVADLQWTGDATRLVTLADEECMVWDLTELTGR